MTGQDLAAVIGGVNHELFRRIFDQSTVLSKTLALGGVHNNGRFIIVITVTLFGRNGTRSKTEQLHNVAVVD